MDVWIRIIFNSIKFGAIAAESLYAKITNKRTYSFPDTWVNLRMYFGFLVFTQVWTVLVLFIYSWTAERSLFQFEMSWALLAGLIVADDFTFYWYHRAQHRMRLLWGSHAGHHSSEEFNYSVGLRQPWVQPFALLFWLPLAYIGFNPVTILYVSGGNFVFQQLLHTKFIGKLGPLEWIFNTPSHHRVHHGSNPEYVDKNFGGILIIWDRCFGTFEPEIAPVVYGLGDGRKHHSATANSFDDFTATIKEFFKQKTADGAWAALFSSPSQRPSDNLERTAG